MAKDLRDRFRGEDVTKFSPDSPELQAIAQLAGVAPSRMAAAFNDPEHIFTHITLEELARFKPACDRFAALSAAIVASCSLAMAALERG